MRKPGTATTGERPLIDAAGERSSMSAYLATVLRLRCSSRAISALGTPLASIERISFLTSRGTVISSILPGRSSPKFAPGKTIRRGPRPWPPGTRPSCSKCSIPDARGAQIPVLIRTISYCTSTLPAAPGIGPARRDRPRPHREEPRRAGRVLLHPQARREVRGPSAWQSGATSSSRP